jgi:hypothetical protein
MSINVKERENSFLLNSFLKHVVMSDRHLHKGDEPKELFIMARGNREKGINWNL